jgi:hypothetical protein
MNFPFLDGVNPLYLRGRIPAATEFESGTRRDVSRLLAACGTVTFGEALRLLSNAWFADAQLSRHRDPGEPEPTDREVESLIQDVAAGVEFIANPTTLGGLYLAGEQRVARSLSRLLRHPRASRRVKAARLCDALCDPLSLDQFAEVDPSDPPEAAKASLRLFARLGDERHLPLIQRAFEHPDEGVCLGALIALRRLPPAATIPLLDEAARKGRPVVCVAALTAMGELGDLTLIPRLMEELGSEASFHRIGAARGLAALARKRPDGDFTEVLEALQRKARVGGVEYRKALEEIRRAIGIDPELPIPAEGGAVLTKSLPIPGEPGDSAIFEPAPRPRRAEDPVDDTDDYDGGSLARRLNNILPRPEEWEYD